MFKSKWQTPQNGIIGNRAGWMLMLPILLLAFVLGANGLNRDIIWIDELHSVTVMGVFHPPYSPSRIVESLRQSGPDHVPLYFFLGALWAQIAGWSQFALRLLSCFFGVLMVAWLYRFAADAVDRRTAIVAALLMSTTAFVVLYFHEIRMYTLFMLLAVMHSWLYWRLAHGFRTTRLTWILFILTTGLLFYTHNFAAVLFAGLGVYHLIFLAKSKRWLNIMLGWGVGALLFLPYIPSVVGALSYADSIINARSGPYMGLLEVFAQLVVNGLEILWLPLMLSLGYALWQRRPRAILGLLVIALAMIVLLLLVSWRFEWIAIKRMRYFLVVWIPVVILFAWGLTSVPRWLIVATPFLLLWGIAGVQLERSVGIYDYAGGRYSLQTYPPLQDYVDNLNNKTREQDYLLGFSENHRVSRAPSNWLNSTADYYLQVQLGVDGTFLHTSLKRYQLERDVRGILREHPRVLLANDPREMSPNYIKALEIIQEDYMLCAVLVDKPDLLIQRYVHLVMDCDHQPAPIEYDNNIKVIDRAARYVPESDLVQILTWWGVADEGLLDEYNVSMQIITPDWRNVRQEDRHLYELPPWNVIELSITGLPPGDYRLMMILYHRGTGEKVGGLDLTNGEAASIFSILTFTIEP